MARLGSGLPPHLAWNNRSNHVCNFEPVLSRVFRPVDQTINENGLRNRIRSWRLEPTNSAPVTADIQLQWDSSQLLKKMKDRRRYRNNYAASVCLHFLASRDLAAARANITYLASFVLSWSATLMRSRSLRRHFSSSAMGPDNWSWILRQRKQTNRKKEIVAKLTATLNVHHFLGRPCVYLAIIYISIFSQP